MKSSTQRTIFWILYSLLAALSLLGSLQSESPLITLISTIVGLILWYFILKLIFWVIRQLCPVFSVLLKFIALIPKALWKFTLDRIREFGKALRDED